MMLPEDPWAQLTPKLFVSAFPPFPRSAWIHPHTPQDNLDRVCRNIWSRAREAGGAPARGRGPPRAPQREDGPPPDSKPSHHRHPCVAKPARALSPVMEVEKKLNEEEEAERKRNSGKDVEDKQRCVENSLRKIQVSQSISRTHKQSSASEAGPLATNPICCATEEAALHLQDVEDPPLSSGDTCKSEDEQDIKRSSDSNASDDDFVTLPGVRSCATDSSDDGSASDSSDCELEENEVPPLSDSEQGSPPSTREKDFPPLSTIRSGSLPCPTEAPALRKMHGQWEIPLSFHPHNNPTATLASGMTAPAQAPVQGEAEAPQANSKTNATPGAATQQEAYDLLADFPALQPPKRPLALGVVHDGNPKTKDAKRQRGLTRPPTIHQESGASRQRRMENVPHEVSSICAGDQKSVANLQTFGSASERKSPTISCREMKANNQPPPRVAGADGVGVNARSWASAAKAGMKQAAAPQEKARPCNFQQIVTVNRAKARYSATQNFAHKVTHSHQVTGFSYGPQPRNPNRFVRPGCPPTHQHSGGPAHRANCPPGFSCPRFPFQQGRGNSSKHNHV
ncbi:nucleolar and coiled-body phosphoprotein 1-like isoform X2 [Trachinotus anak]|uniref:nucleolar and coiled-body phosphoprotein 1-like isoform X2 n=1 Tax=Trachinotus anak TaxID=443729 RepID=UPI0039F20F1E